MTSFHWWFKTDAGLAARVAIGAAIFVLLAATDLMRHGRAAQRWREYAFLLLTTAIGMSYGIVNDTLTSTLSWEYYYYGKGLADVMPAQTPPDSGALRKHAAGIGIKAGGSAGIVIGAALLIANNPRPARRRLSYRQLVTCVSIILGVAIVCSLLLGAAGAAGWLRWTSSDLARLWTDDAFRPRRFMGVYGMHLGAYLGGAVGMIGAVAGILKARVGNAPDWADDKPGF